MDATADNQSSSLYRRHRPRTFSDVIGQEHVVRTLRNAIDQNSVHHAYMFVGSRGTGKTSMAKILASALNATGGPSSEFDANDRNVVAIANGTSIDVVEMDAASHNGVDDIRDLIESVALVSSGGGWKVYILDEAHMITPQGWNAFLKTLEEPPPNTIFVLATTEANKILPTVADRCHRFDFRRPTVEQLSQALRRAADAESISIGDDAVAMIARAATGSFRDALGTLEQLVTYGGSTVSSEDVQAVLGVADFDMLLKTADAIAAGDRRGVLQAIGELADSGRDIVAFARDLAIHLRNLLVAETLGEAPDALGINREQSVQLVEQATRLGAERASHSLDLISRMIAASRAGGDPRLQLEIALFKAARPEDDNSPDALLARIESLEQRAAASASAQSGNTVGAPSVTDSAPTPAPTPPKPSSIDAASQAAVNVAESAEAKTVSEVAVADMSPPAVDEAATDFPTEQESPSEPPPLEAVINRWSEVIAAVHETSPRLGAALELSRPLGADGRKLRIAFPESNGFVRKAVDQPKGRALIASKLLEVMGFEFAITTELVPDQEATPEDADGGGIDGAELIERLKKEFDAIEKAEPNEAHG